LNPRPSLYDSLCLYEKRLILAHFIKNSELGKVSAFLDTRKRVKLPLLAVQMSFYLWEDSGEQFPRPMGLTFCLPVQGFRLPSSSLGIKLAGEELATSGFSLAKSSLFYQHIFEKIYYSIEYSI